MYAHIILLIGLSMFATDVSATEWESLVKKPGSELLVDLDSYDENGAYSSILAKYETHSKQYVAKQMKLEFDCKHQTYRTLASASFDAKGKLLNQAAGNQGFTPVQNDERANAVSTLVCQVRRMISPSS